MSRKINCIDQETIDFLEKMRREILYWTQLSRNKSPVPIMHMRETATKIQMFIYRKTEKGFFKK